MDEIAIEKYPAYKDSGLELLGEIPEHWEVLRVKNCCDMIVSNVDKISKQNEVPVRLCNYVDVYKNDFITSSLAFMNATATKDEIERFRIQENDVLITKDSEDWKDIGVPSLVEYSDSNLICGYHLAILRPINGIAGRYLMRALLAQYIRHQFSVNANGITRYGISHGVIKSAFILLPPTEEQTAIAHFLDAKTEMIDRAITIKEKQIELLKERRQILIYRAVTRGLNPNVKFKDSGVEWIGDIPEHWEIVKNRSLFVEKNLPGNEYLPILSVSIHTAVSSEELNEEDNLRGKTRIEDKSAYKLVKPGFIVFNMMRAWQGAIGCVNTNGMVSPAYIVAEPNHLIDSTFFEYMYRTTAFIQQMDRYSKGITDFRKRLYWNEFKQLITLLPPIKDQLEIIKFIKMTSEKINIVIEKKKQEIQKIKEYKFSLINSAVTGKIKVC